MNKREKGMTLDDLFLLLRHEKFKDMEIVITDGRINLRPKPPVHPFQGGHGDFFDTEEKFVAYCVSELTPPEMVTADLLRDLLESGDE